MKSSREAPHSIARDYARGDRALERVVRRLEAGPAFPAELHRASRLEAAVWRRRWREMCQGQLVTRRPGGRKWRLRPERAFLAGWAKGGAFEQGMLLPPRLYARCQALPRDERIRLWELAGLWDRRIECPFCGRIYPAPSARTWQPNAQVHRACPHLLFVAGYQEGWYYRSARLVKFLQGDRACITQDMLELASLGNASGEALCLAWPGAVLLHLYDNTRSFVTFISGVLAGFAPAGPPARSKADGVFLPAWPDRDSPRSDRRGGK